MPPAALSPRDCPGIPIKTRRVALSRHQPGTPSHPEPVREIRELYADAIEAAEELIYIENQYFTAHTVGRSLARRMRDMGRPPLDIVLALPRQLPTWLEAATPHLPRLRLLRALSGLARETGYRLGVYSIAAPDGDGSEVATLIHSKILVVDDRFLTVGSVNTSNRSMGLDTELNVSWEALSPDNHALLDSTRRVRVCRLAEHCGLRRRGARRELLRKKGLVEDLDHLCDAGPGRLRHLTREATPRDRGWLAQLERWGFSFDPDVPVLDNILRTNMGETRREQST